MSNTTFVVALRLVGIWIILTWIPKLYQLLAFLADRMINLEFGVPLHIGVGVAIALAWFTFGIMLLLRPVVFGQRLVPGGVRGGGPTPWSPTDFVAVVIRIFGLYLIITAIASREFWDVPLRGFTVDKPDALIDLVVGGLAVGAKLIFGVWLLLGAHRLVEFLQLARREGNAKADAASE